MKTPAVMIGSRFGVIGSNLLTGVVLARAMPVDTRGVFATLITVPGLIAMLLTAGLDSATLRLSGRDEDRSTAVQAALRRGMQSIAVPALGVLFLAFGPGEYFEHSALAWAMGMCAVPLLVSNQLLGNCAIGANDARVWARATVANAVTYLLLAAGVLAAQVPSLEAFLACFLMANAVCLGILLRWLLKARPRERLASKKSLRMLRKTALGTAAPTIAQLAIMRIPIPLMAALAGTDQVGILAIALPFAESLLIVPVMVASYLLPRYHAETPKGSMVHRHASIVFAATVVFGSMVAFLAPLLLPRIYGDNYEGAVKLVVILLPGIAVFSYTRIVQSHLYATGRYVAVTAASVAGLGISVLIQVSTVPRLGAVGGALGITLGYCVATAVIGLTYHYNRPRVTA
ncbi:lipopolysaccharide biosynthesis protein [Intrasporangium chromatireducens]|uniref:lipopolysaccharide biosynthesis protein n=1 Tax=Intrasporangium chromatireducens TaxID=1386088 RepID=UPI00138DF41E|nr:polysaccharide biosynthesis C-terminal domain-containing protein [Intrasporangium chromatireducens]